MTSQIASQFNSQNFVLLTSQEMHRARFASSTSTDGRKVQQLRAPTGRCQSQLTLLMTGRSYMKGPSLCIACQYSTVSTLFHFRFTRSRSYWKFFFYLACCCHLSKSLLGKMIGLQEVGPIGNIFLTSFYQNHYQIKLYGLQEVLEVDFLKFSFVNLVSNLLPSLEKKVFTYLVWQFIKMTS